MEEWNYQLSKLWFSQATEDRKQFDVVAIGKILAWNLLIYIYVPSLCKEFFVMCHNLEHSTMHAKLRTICKFKRYAFHYVWQDTLSQFQYWNCIFKILKFEISCLMNWIFSLFKTWILQATAGRKIDFERYIWHLMTTQWYFYWDINQFPLSMLILYPYFKNWQL